jgi:hypothetical protein
MRFPGKRCAPSSDRSSSALGKETAAAEQLGSPVVDWAFSRKNGYLRHTTIAGIFAASRGPDIFFATLVVRWDLLVQLVRKVLYGRDVTQLRNLAVRFRLFDAESATD